MCLLRLRGREMTHGQRAAAVGVLILPVYCSLGAAEVNLTCIRVLNFNAEVLNCASITVQMLSASRWRRPRAQRHICASWCLKHDRPPGAARNSGTAHATGSVLDSTLCLVTLAECRAAARTTTSVARLDPDKILLATSWHTSTGRAYDFGWHPAVQCAAFIGSKRGL